MDAHRGKRPEGPIVPPMTVAADVPYQPDRDDPRGLPPGLRPDPGMPEKKGTPPPPGRADEALGDTTDTKGRRPGIYVDRPIRRRRELTDVVGIWVTVVVLLCIAALAVGFTVRIIVGWFA